MPSREGETVLEMCGMAPIPQVNRYGRLHRIFSVWLTPNFVPAGFFIGTLGTANYIGVGFALGVVAIVISTVLGGLLVSILYTSGPVTGVGHILLARLTFGKTVVIQGARSGYRRLRGMPSIRASARKQSIFRSTFPFG